MGDSLPVAHTFAPALSVGYGEAKRPKRYQRTAKVRLKAVSFKRIHFNTGHGCEVCGWRPADYKLLHAHHVVPLSRGGTDAVRNTVVVCPNHHAVAHRLGTRKHGVYSGPTTREQLLDALAAYDKPKG